MGRISKPRLTNIPITPITKRINDNTKEPLESTNHSASYDNKELQTYTDSLEEKIRSFLGNIGGISNVSVIVTVESSAERVYATQGSNSDYVIVTDPDGGENTVPLTEISAKIRGIAVVCDYGGNDALRIKIIELLASLFDIGSNRISVISAYPSS